MSDRGVSMPKRRRVLYECPACMTMAEAYHLKALGGKPREPFRDVNGHVPPGVVVRSILCWWCRTMHHPDEVDQCMAMQRPKAAVGDGSTSSWIAKMPPWLTQFPEVWEFLSKGSYKDSTPRQLGKVSLCLVADGIQMTLTDPTSCTYCSRHFRTIEDALLGFEIGLGDGSLSWKASGPMKGRKRP
jgi:hypothetical protein